MSINTGPYQIRYYGVVLVPVLVPVVVLGAAPVSVPVVVLGAAPVSVPVVVVVVVLGAAEVSVDVVVLLVLVLGVPVSGVVPPPHALKEATRATLAAARAIV